MTTQVSQRLAAQAMAAAFAVNAVLGFLLHWPCRNSGYTDSRFTSFCYSDFAAWLSAPPLSDGHSPFGGDNPLDIAPIPAGLAWLAAQVPGGFTIQFVTLQLFMAIALMVVAVAVLKLRSSRPLDASLLLLLPLWPLTMYVSSDLVAVAFAACALLLWKRNQSVLAGVFTGLAIASGAWTWLLLAVFIVDALRAENRAVAIRTTLLAVGIAFFANLPRLFAHQPLLNKFDFQAGEGTLLFVVGLITQSAPTTNFFIWIAGLLLTLVTCVWAYRLPFDFRIEALLLLLVVLQTLSAIGIQPQTLTHFIWLLPLVWPARNWLLAINLPLMVYVAAVWLRFEAGVENGKGVSSPVYAVFCAVLWWTLILIGRRAERVLVVQGIDVVAQADAKEARSHAASHS